MSKLLINESPLVLLPSLANTLQCAEKALMCQQLYYLLSLSEQVADGKRWITLTIDKSDKCKSWQDIISWRSVDTIKRHLNTLIELGIILKRNLNSSNLDRTLSWSIDEEKLDAITHNASVQNALIEEERLTGKESQNTDSSKMTPSISAKCTDINTESSKEVRSNLSFNTRLNTISPNGDIADAAHQHKNVSEILDGEVIPDTPPTQDSGSAEKPKSFTAAAVDKRDPDVEKVLLVIREATGCEPEDPKGRAYVRFFAKSLANKLLRIAPSTPLGQSIFAVLSAARFLAEHGQTWDWDRAAQPRYLYRNCETIMRKFRSLPGRDTPVIPTL